MLFEIVEGAPVPVLPYTADGAPRAADGATLFTLEQAAARTGKSEATLRQIWNAVWGGYVPPEDVDVPPVITDVTGGGVATSPAAAAERTKLAILHRIRFPHLGDDQFNFVVEVARLKRLNLWSGQLAADVSYDPSLKREVLSIITTIDAFRSIARRTGLYANQSRPLFCGPDGAWKEIWPDDVLPFAAKVGVIHASSVEPFEAIAFWKEHARYMLGPDKTPVLVEAWAKMPRLMLAKCAEAKAFRLSFPGDAECGGLYTFDELPPRPRGQNPAPRPFVGGPGGAGLEPAAASTAIATADDDWTQGETAGPRSERELQSALINAGFRRVQERVNFIERMRETFPTLASAPDPTRFYAAVMEYIRENPDGLGELAR